MECKFCGAKIDEKDIRCASCGGELERITDPEENLKIIDEMPELHDELDKIGVVREKSSGRKKRIIIAVIIVLVCLIGASLGMYFVKSKSATKDVDANMTPELSAVPGSSVSITEGIGFCDVTVTDEESAIKAINSQRARLGVTDERTSYKLKSKITVGTDTFYRFGQYLGSIRVYGSEMIVMADKDGTPIMLNGTFIETDGLDTSASLSTANASNAVLEYINKLSADYALKEGINITQAEKVVCNFGESTYLAYLYNVSGYNENSKFTAYDVLIDADNGSGIYYVATANYENEGEKQAVQTPPAPTKQIISAPATYFTVNDKFNWNDETKTSAKDEIDKQTIDSGETSAFIKDVKTKTDMAYTYFNNSVMWDGLDGKGKGINIYINPNEYVENELPPEKAIYSNGVITFIEEDLINACVSANTVTHEYAHAVMQSVSYLNGTMEKSENSVIAESYADVFGELYENYFYGGADWTHGERNISIPSAPYLTERREGITITDISSVYQHSTIVSHALYKMNAAGINTNVLGKMMFASVCMMTQKTDLSQWRAILETIAYHYMNQGVISDLQFDAVCDILESTGISAEKLYVAEPQEEITDEIN